MNATADQLPEWPSLERDDAIHFVGLGGEFGG
jgi:hypothetical protein